MSTLYIIGNGLDLFFGLNTGVESFRGFLKNEKVYNQYCNALDVFEGYNVDWNDFELSLSELDIESIVSDNLNAPDYLSDRESDRDGVILDMEMFVDSLRDAADNALHKMVAAANAKLLQKKPLDVSPIVSGDAVLSFNYTSTIEELFPLPDDVPVLHIHGFLEEDSSLILGYKEESSESKSYISNCSIEEEDYYISKQIDLVIGFYKSFAKEYRFNDLTAFLNDCKGVDKVVVLGHSMGEIDRDYMEQIEKVIRPVSWVISRYEGAPNDNMLKEYSFYSKIDKRQTSIKELLFHV